VSHYQNTNAEGCRLWCIAKKHQLLKYLKKAKTSQYQTMLGRARSLMPQTTPELGVCRGREEAFITSVAFMVTYRRMYLLSLPLRILEQCHLKLKN